MNQRDLTTLSKNADKIIDLGQKMVKTFGGTLAMDDLARANLRVAIMAGLIDYESTETKKKNTHGK
jgi:hypothetical protein